MTHATTRSSPIGADGSIVCPSCGGSGTLRMGDQAFRTCLNCLGQGRIPGLEAATTTAAVLHSPAPDRDSQPAHPLKDAASSGAR